MKNRLATVARWSLGLLILAVLVCLMALVGFMWRSAQVDSLKIPPELKKTPAIIADLDSASTRLKLSSFPAFAPHQQEDTKQIRAFNQEAANRMDAEYMELFRATNGDQVLYSLNDAISHWRDTAKKGFLTLTKVQVEWIHSHRDYYEKLHRLLDAAQRQSETSRLVNFPLNDMGVAYLLLAEGQVHLTQQKFTLALECFMDIFSMIYLPPCENYEFITRQIIMGSNDRFNDPFLDDWEIKSLMLTKIAERVIQAWIEDSVLGKNDLPTIRPELRKIEETLFESKRIALEELRHYVLLRQNLISKAGTPWKSSWFGWDVEENLWRYNWRVDPAGIYLEIPNPFAYLKTTQHCMNNKETLIHKLSALDCQWKERIENITAVERINYHSLVTWGDLEHELKVGQKKKSAAFFKYNTLLAQTRMHLIRAALEVMGNPAALAARPPEQTDLSADPYNPWRDPFTDRPLRVLSTTTQTLIYSVGPDLKDQQGRVEYAPEHNAIVPGDLTIRIRH